jgi:hypothetical protein
VLNAAVVVEECATGAFHQGLELRHLIGAAADIKDLRAVEARCSGRVLPEPAVDLDLDEREFAAQVLAFPRGVLMGALGLRLHKPRLLDLSVDEERLFYVAFLFEDINLK